MQPSNFSDSLTPPAAGGVEQEADVVSSSAYAIHEIAEALVGETAALDAIEAAATEGDALYRGLVGLESEVARRSFCRVLQKRHERDVELAGKTAAMGLYASGLTSLDATTLAFARHPGWRHA